MDVKAVFEGIVAIFVAYIFYMVLDQMGKIPGFEAAGTFKFFMALVIVICMLGIFVAAFRE